MDTNNNEREFYTLTDEDGNEIEFELIGAAELKGVTYYAMIPADAADRSYLRCRPGSAPLPYS
jgi:uncharacterized protein YrzB (UPF0473 family)